MKRKSLLFLLLAAMFAPLAMNGQQTAVLNDGTTTMSYVPFYGYYADYGAKGQFIIPASDLADKGITSGCQISKLKFFSDASSTATYFGSSVKVEVGEVSNTTFSSSAFVTSGLTTVLSGTTLSRSSDGTLVIQFTSNYTYNGGNLLISIGGYGSNAPRTSWLGISSDNAGVYGYNSSNSQTIPSSASGRTSYAPKTEITYLPGNTPYISLAPTAATVFTGFTQTLTATYGNVSGTPTITYSSSNTSVATVSGSGTTATVTAVAEGTATITATMNGSYTATCAITVEDPSYCTPNPSSRDGKGITAVTFGTDDVVSNSNSNGLPASSPYYGDYTSMVGSIEAGEVATVSITYTTGYDYGTLIWVDWNKNYTFEDSEIVFEGQSSQQSNPSGSHTLDATFTVPANQATDDYRMRIAGADSYFDRYLSGYSDGDHDACFSSTYAVCHDYSLRVTPASNCKKPTDLAATNVTKNSATLSWIENGEATAWNISVNGNVTPNVTNPYNLTGLTPETSYTVKVSPVCEVEKWSDEITFTTLVACPAPTNVTASNVTNNSAVINWEGNAESYNVRYRRNNNNAIFFEGFEEGLPSTWTTIDSDGDGFNWGYHINTGSGNYTTHTGDGVAISASYDSDNKVALTPDNWLITPQLNLQGTMKVWLCGQDSDDYLEHFAIYLSTTERAINDFTTILIGETITGDEMVEYTADLSDYAGQPGYIAIRHFNCTDQFWLNVDDFGIYDGEAWNTLTATESPVTLTGLDAETDYEVQVQANCGSEDGTSAWVSTTFTTLDDCALPYELSTTNITAASATLNWTGAQEAYNVRYRSYTLGEPQENVFEEGFEGGSMPTGWTTTGSYWKITSGTGNSSYTGSATGDYNAGCYISSYSGSDILITPAIDLSHATSATLTFNFWNTSWSGDINTLNVYYRVDGGNWSSALYTNNSEVTPWTSISVTLPSSGFAANYQIGFECVTNYSYGMGIDDVKITYTAQSVTPGEWVTKTNVTSPLNLDDLTPTIENGNHYLPTNYEWQVQGVDCDGNGTATDWSDMSTFTTLEGYFKPITGYGTSTGNWYLIASPIGNVDPAKVTNMLSNNYDLFYFNQAMDNEWVNYKDANGNPGAFNTLVSGKGYLYANKYNVTLVFTGSAYTTTEGTETVDLDYTSGEGIDLPGWNLVGNPFAETAYLAGNCSFYTMDTDGLFAPATNLSIEPMEGIFVEASATGQSVTFTTTQPTKSPALNLNLSNGRKVVDRAIVRFDGGKQLSKLQFREGSTKVYIPVEGHDYAVVSCEEMGELPVSFKAEENGSYNLSLSSEEVSFAYLHLIDNMTGADVDLLQTPSYSFEAKTTDYANRFKLVFATGDNSNDDNFAFFSNGSFVINNDGEATLQVIDVTGRILSSESINGCANVNVNAASGVYMLRLINGDNVKVQKVVVK